MSYNRKIYDSEELIRNRTDSERKMLWVDFAIKELCGTRYGDDRKSYFIHFCKMYGISNSAIESFTHRKSGVYRKVDAETVKNAAKLVKECKIPHILEAFAYMENAILMDSAPIIADGGIKRDRFLLTDKLNKMEETKNEPQTATIGNTMLPEVNFADLHFKSLIGIQVRSQIALAMIEYVNYEHKPTWAEKRKGELVWKLKTKKANLNKFIVTILMIPSVALILGIVLGLTILVQTELTGILLGIAGSQLMILAYYFWTYKFECNANYIRAKHKGKIYFW